MVRTAILQYCSNNFFAILTFIQITTDCFQSSTIAFHSYLRKREGTVVTQMQITFNI